MDTSRESARPFIRAIQRWQHTGIWCDDDSNETGKPGELTAVEVTEAICQRYHVLPTQVRPDEYRAILRHMRIYDAAHPPTTYEANKEAEE